jgi:lipoyl(octanoyl) transferase
VVPPRLVEENGFAARCSEGFEVHLGEEHDAHEWVDVPTALARLPFRGLREGVLRAAKALT